MGDIERVVELEDFAVYCETVVLDTVGAQRRLWQDRAEWARDCAADFRGAVEALRAIAADPQLGGTGHPVDVLARAALEALGLDPTGGQS
jgi:malate/lactate dehydrogenase